MASPAELYARGVKKKLKYYYVAWLPNEELRLGDIGILTRGLFFRREGNVSDLGIKFNIRRDPNPSPFTLQSEKGVQITSKAAGEISPKFQNIANANAGVAVDFSAKGAFIIKAASTYEPAIEDMLALETDIINLYKNRRWQKKFVIIAKIVTAPVATIIVSRSSSGKIELTAEGNLAVGSTVQLGDAKVIFNASFTSGDIINLTNAQNVTPFFQLVGLKQRWFRDDTTLQFKAADYTSAPINKITPAMVRKNKKVASSLYLDLI